MAKPIKIYWDSCAWLGFLNGETDKKRELEIIYSSAKKGRFELWTSTLAMVEVRRLEDEMNAAKPLGEENLRKIRDVFRQPFVQSIPLDVDIAERARECIRTTVGLGKWQDAVHLMSALRWNMAMLHTYDNEDLLHLNMKFTCRNGTQLAICYPDETTDGPLFAQAAKQ